MAYRCSSKCVACACARARLHDRLAVFPVCVERFRKYLAPEHSLRTLTCTSHIARVRPRADFRSTWWCVVPCHLFWSRAVSHAVYGFNIDISQKNLLQCSWGRASQLESILVQQFAFNYGTHRATIEVVGWGPRGGSECVCKVHILYGSLHVAILFECVVATAATVTDAAVVSRA